MRDEHDFSPQSYTDIWLLWEQCDIDRVFERTSGTLLQSYLLKRQANSDSMIYYYYGCWRLSTKWPGMKSISDFTILLYHFYKW